MHPLIARFLDLPTAIATLEKAESDSTLDADESALLAASIASPKSREAVLKAKGKQKASAEAEQMDQLLFGELFEVLDGADGWAFGQARRDGYVGYVEAAALGVPGPAPTHTVRALRTYGYSGPSIKTAPIGLYSMNALVCVEAEDGRFVKTAGGWFIAEHLAPIDQPRCRA